MAPCILLLAVVALIIAQCGWILLGLGALAIAGYWAAVATSPPGHGVSSIPLVGGGLVFAGCALVPQIGWKLGLIAIAIDPGCWFPIALPISWLVDRSRRRNR